MTSVGQIQDIISLYEKHGWTLRRVFLSAQLRENLGALEIRFGETAAETAAIDAAWFSRPARDGGETWELRRLIGSRFALVEIFVEVVFETVRDEARHEIEKQMENGKLKKNKAV